MKKFTVCLDIDETIIHSTETRLSPLQVPLGPYWTYKRPGLDIFFSEIGKFAEIGLYTAASKKYAETFVADFLGDVDLKFVLSGERCVQQMWRRDLYGNGRDEGYIKDLKKVVKHRSDLSRLVAIDDKPYLYPRQYGNIIGVPAYKGAKDDDLLIKLAKYLRFLNGVEDVRTIEKRNWLAKYNFEYNIS